GAGSFTAGAGDDLISAGEESGAGSDATCCTGSAAGVTVSGFGGGAVMTFPSKPCGSVAGAICGDGICAGGSTATCSCARAVFGMAGVPTAKAGTPRDASGAAGAASSETSAGDETLACAILGALCLGLSKNTTPPATIAATVHTTPIRSIIGQGFDTPAGGSGTRSGSSAR